MPETAAVETQQKIISPRAGLWNRFFDLSTSAVLYGKAGLRRPSGAGTPALFEPQGLQEFDGIRVPLFLKKLRYPGCGQVSIAAQQLDSIEARRVIVVIAGQSE